MGMVSRMPTNQEWTLTGTSGVSVSDQKTGPVPQGTKWTLNLPGKILLEMTQGSTPFGNGDTLSFSTFKAKSSTGKQNDIDVGKVTVDDEL